MPAPGSHYFDEEPTTESAPREVTLLLPDAQLTLRTDRGVFGYDRIDAGTKLLLLKAPPPAPTGDLLDIGCGTGAIALTMARRSPGATVWAVDVNERARDLCRGNAERNGLSPTFACAPPTRCPTTCGSPRSGATRPIRIGKPALHAMLLRWFGRLTRRRRRRCWWCTSTSAATRCRPGSARRATPPTASPRSAGYRILRSTAGDSTNWAVWFPEDRDESRPEADSGRSRPEPVRRGVGRPRLGGGCPWGEAWRRAPRRAPSTCRRAPARPSAVGANSRPVAAANSSASAPSTAAAPGTAAGRAARGGPVSARHHALRVGELHRGEHLVVRLEGLHHHPAAAAARRPTSRAGAHQQRQRVLGGPIARRQQLGVEVEERDHVDAAHPVQHRFGARRTRRPRAVRRCRR